MALIGTDIDFAIELLKKDELVAIPTETVYGLAGNALSEKAVLKIFETKERPQFDPLIVHIAAVDWLDELVVDVPEKAKVLISNFWPGPLTVVLEKQKVVPDLVSSGLGTVGLRMPNHPLTLELLRKLSFPLAAPSANPFGYISPTEALHVDKQLGGKISYIVDGGKCKVGLESTIIGFENTIPVIYRLGGISIEQLRAVLPDIELAINISSNPKAPGQLKSHYAPKTRLILTNDFSSLQIDTNTGILDFGSSAQSLKSAVYFDLSPSADLNEAALNLFSMLRQLDDSGVKSIYAKRVTDSGIGKAINDRLERAAAK